MGFAQQDPKDLFPLFHTRDMLLDQTDFA